MQILDGEILTSLAAKAAGCTRRRANWNLHPTLDDSVQRLCNAIEPDSYVQPHRHLEAAKWEFFLALRGAAVIVTFDEAARLSKRVIIAPTGPCYAVEIPAGEWHSVASLEGGTVLFELKPGPYSPLEDKDFAPWAPAQGIAACSIFLEWFKSGAVGSEPPVERSGWA